MLIKTWLGLNALLLLDQSIFLFTIGYDYVSRFSVSQSNILIDLEPALVFENSLPSANEVAGM